MLSSAEQDRNQIGFMAQRYILNNKCYCGRVTITSYYIESEYHYLSISTFLGKDIIRSEPFTICNKFVSIIKHQVIPSSYKLVSFDVKSLF